MEELKKRAAQLQARIQQAEARQRESDKKADDRVKVLTGAAILNLLKHGIAVHIDGPSDLIIALDGFLERQKDRDAVIGDGSGSEAFKRLTTKKEGHENKFTQQETMENQ